MGDPLPGMDPYLERACNDVTVDHEGEPVPPLEGAERAWAGQLLVASGRRRP